MTNHRGKWTLSFSTPGSSEEMKLRRGKGASSPLPGPGVRKNKICPLRRGKLLGKPAPESVPIGKREVGEKFLVYRCGKKPSQKRGPGTAFAPGKGKKEEKLKVCQRKEGSRGEEKMQMSQPLQSRRRGREADDRLLISAFPVGSRMKIRRQGRPFPGLRKKGKGAGEWPGIVSLLTGKKKCI